MKNTWILLVMFVTLLLSCRTVPKNDGFKLTKIVYHTTRCFGWCPVIDMQVDDKRAITVNRLVFPQGKGAAADSSKSGMYTGTISQANYDTLVSLLVKSNIDSMKFPNQMCCDAPVVTLIVHHNGKRKYLKSMFPPEEAQPLIEFLRKLALDSTLTKVNTIEKIEE